MQRRTETVHISDTKQELLPCDPLIANGRDERAQF